MIWGVVFVRIVEPFCQNHPTALQFRLPDFDSLADGSCQMYEAAMTRIDFEYRCGSVEGK